MTQTLLDSTKQCFANEVDAIFIATDDTVTLDVAPDHLVRVMQVLQDNAQFDFKLFIDICGADFSQYGESEWRTHETTESGFSRGKDETQCEQIANWTKPRFGVIYHLLSVGLNQRIRVRVFLPESNPTVPSMVSIWAGANWFEREAFDLYGIVFDGHPDLRRLLTDYGFVGHPFRKDFPLIGEVELRYDAGQERCVYEPVSIQPRVNVPKVIREDSRYEGDNLLNPVEKES